MGAANTWFWLKEDGEEKFVSDLIFDIGSDLAKSIFAGVAATMLVGAIAASFTVAIPVFSVIIGTVVLGMAIGLALDYLDENSGITDSIKAGSKTLAPNLKALWNEMIDNPLERILNRCVWEMKRGAFP